MVDVPMPPVDLAIFVARSANADAEALDRLARWIGADAARELEAASGVRWRVHVGSPTTLPDDTPRRAADFLDEATLRLVEGPYDLIVVVTDVGLVSRGTRVVPGLASEISRVAVLSTRRLLLSPRGEEPRSLESHVVRFNAAALLQHLIGVVLGVSPHRGAGPMAGRFSFDPSLSAVPPLDERSRALLRQRVSVFPEREAVRGGPFRALAFQIASTLRHPLLVGRVLLRNGAPVLALSLPGLATAAVVPTLVLIFTAEIWDVGLHMTNSEVVIFGTSSIAVAAWYLTAVQSLFFPRRERRVVTEHLAVLNVTVFLSVLLAVIGLFVMVAALMLLMVFYIFPAGLIATWPTLQEPVVTVFDKLRLASFISSIGVLTGALGGGLDKRSVIRHLALFRREH